MTDIDEGENSCSLTKREWELVADVIEGLHNWEIAGRRCITENTVETHLRHVYKKLGVKSRTQLLIWVLTHDPIREKVIRILLAPSNKSVGE